ncbi:hypothetical protein ABFS83_01G082400 [Erythranthe nasuta]
MALYVKPLWNNNIFLLLPTKLSKILLILIFCLISLSDEITDTSKNNKIDNIGGGVTADLIHGDSPLSPFYDPSLTRFKRVTDSLRHSFLRHHSIRSNDSKSSSLTSPAPEASLAPVSGYYLMKIQLGNPPIELLGIADTGSDLTWTQCAPCSDCYKQKTPIFDPKKSETYDTVSCKSQECQSLRYEHPSCDNATDGCRYELTYAGRSYTSGDLATETLTFDQNLPFPKVVFGCGHHNYGDNLGTSSGIVGLGGGPVSIIRQLKKYYSIDAKISYCLPPPNSNVSSKINFGSNAVVSGPKVMSTPLVKREHDTFHYFTFVGISIGNNKLAFKSKKEITVEEGNMFIDTGSTYTFLSDQFYSKFVTALKKALSGTPTANPQGEFRLCYENPTNGKFNSPTITAHFRGGVDLVLSPEGIFVEANKGVVCLAILPSYSTDLLVFGNLQQMNYLIGIDLENQKVDFLPTNDCTNY